MLDKAQGEIDEGVYTLRTSMLEFLIRFCFKKSSARRAQHELDFPAFRLTGYIKELKLSDTFHSKAEISGLCCALRALDFFKTTANKKFQHDKKKIYSIKSKAEISGLCCALRA